MQISLTNRSDFHVGCVGHKEMSVEIGWPCAGRRSHSHDGVERNWTRNVLDDVRHQPLAINVSLEICVLVDLAAAQAGDLSDRRQVNIRVVEDK